jgi:ABC-type multidrug transport system permease subunit
MFGLSFAFSNDRDAYTVGVYQAAPEINADEHPFLATQFIHFVPYDDFDLAMSKVARHQLDLLVEFGDTPKYWVNPESPKGYFAEIALLQSESDIDSGIDKQQISGDAVGYADWLLPGILGMNMMFSCLFGVGYVVVRYRKNGFLKRLRATPLTSFEFIAAQVASRMVLILMITTFIYTGTHWILGTQMAGNYFTLFLIAVVGAISLISLGLVISARVTSEELAGGLLNLINWPMMMLSGVWFSLEGAPDAIQKAASIFPLTHILNAARAVMLDGATLTDVGPALLALTAMSAVFLAIGAKVFRWSQY